MAQALHTRTRGNALAIWAILVILAGVIFWGIWASVSTHPQQANRSAPVVTHSVPVGGKILDGVFHPIPVDEQDFTRWRI